VYKKILIINPFGIGDVLFTTPLIHTLKDAFPEAKIDYLCNRRSAPILEGNPYINSIFIYERDEFEAMRQRSFFAWLKSINAFLKQLREEHFDLSLDFSLNAQYGFFSLFAGIKERAGYDYKKRQRFLTKRIELLGFSEKHIVDYYLGLLGFLDLNIDSKYRHLELYLEKEDTRKADEILSKEDISENDLLVAAITGAGRSWGRDAYLKHWPPEKFAKLADKIVENYQAKIIIMGDFSEEEITRKILDKMRYPAVNLCGKTNLRELAALINKMSLVVTNDGGPLHMAVALDKKTLSFFGPVDPKVYGPYPADRSQHIVLRKNLECSPCYRNFRLTPCMLNRQCLETITVEEALEAVDGLLKG